MTKETLAGIIKQFEYYKSLGEKAIEQVSENQLFISLSPESNSIAVIVQHLSGNMLSRWTDIFNTDGEKEWRKRDEEFIPIITTKTDLMVVWGKGWQALFSTINSLKNNDLERIIYIRNQGHTVSEAIARQLAHYPYHIGQIVFLAKYFSDRNWQSLSIAKNQSNAYNTEKFSAEKTKTHFTDEYLKKKNNITLLF